MKKKNLSLVAIAVLLLLLVVAVSQINKQQRDRRSKAAETGVTLSMSADKTTAAEGDVVTIDVNIDTKSHQVSAVELHIKFPQELAEAISFVAEPLFPVILSKPFIEPGQVAVIVGRQPTADESQKGFTGVGKLAVLKIKMKSSAETRIDFDPRTAVAAIGQTGNVTGALAGITINQPVTTGVQKVTMSLRSTKTTVKPLEEITIDVVMDTKGRPVSAADFCISFNPDLFTAIDIKEGPALSLSLPLPSSKQKLSAGKACIIVAIGNPTTPFTGTGVVATLTLKTSENASSGSADIAITADSQVAATDDLINNALDLSSLNNPLKITILGASDTPPPGVSTTPKPTLACPQASKDANGDGVVDVIDFEVWRREFTKEEAGLKADFNCDSQITLIDFNQWRFTYFSINSTF